MEWGEEDRVLLKELQAEVQPRALNDPPIYDDDRSDWGAAAPLYINAVAITSRTEYFTHYDGGVNVGLFGKDHARCLERVKAIQTFHMKERGWSDIGYNALVCVHGRLIQGRGRDRVGAHCTNHNTSGIGVQFMVGGTEKITDVMKARMRKFYDQSCSAAGTTLAKKGHRDGMSTDCPGDYAYAWVQAGMPYPAGSVVTPPPTPTYRWTRENVKSLQSLLECPLVDGLWGDNTDGRFMAFRAVANPSISQTTSQIRLVQSIVEARVDGILGNETAGKVRAMTDDIQRILKVSADGYWGSITDKAALAMRREQYRY
jgi:hypothetical protein